MRPTLLAVHPVLMAADVAESTGFYRDLGFALVFQDSPDDAKYAVLERDGVQIHLQWADATQWAHPVDRPVYRFLVDDVDALHAQIGTSGRSGSGESRPGPWAAPADTPWRTREFHLRDPGQNGLQFYRML